MQAKVHARGAEAVCWEWESGWRGGTGERRGKGRCKKVRAAVPLGEGTEAARLGGHKKRVGRDGIYLHARRFGATPPLYQPDISVIY